MRPLARFVKHPRTRDRRLFATVVFSALLSACGTTRVLDQRPTPDVIDAEGGPITIAPITHATVAIAHGTTVMLVDPVKYASVGAGPVARVDYGWLPPPTHILVTDIHGDHEDPKAISTLRTPNTVIVIPRAASADISGATVMNNGQSTTLQGVAIEAVPMYNLDGSYHTRGRGNGYVVTLGGKRLYFAGDTSCTPEMRALMRIDVAFLPMNLPFTMPPAKAAECARAFKPRIAYPYHYSGQDVHVFESAVAGTGIEVRLRDWYMGGS